MVITQSTGFAAFISYKLETIARIASICNTTCCLLWIPALFDPITSNLLLTILHTKLEGLVIFTTIIAQTTGLTTLVSNVCAWYVPVAPFGNSFVCVHWTSCDPLTTDALTISNFELKVIVVLATVALSA